MGGQQMEWLCEPHFLEQAGKDGAASRVWCNSMTCTLHTSTSIQVGLEVASGRPWEVPSLGTTAPFSPTEPWPCVCSALAEAVPHPWPPWLGPCPWSVPKGPWQLHMSRSNSAASETLLVYPLNSSRGLGMVISLWLILIVFPRVNDLQH